MSPDNVHASQMRLSLSRTSAFAYVFIKCLPSFLSSRDKIEFWEERKKRLRPIDEVVRPKIALSLEGRCAASNPSLCLNETPNVDSVFESRGLCGKVRVTRYAGDTTAAGTFGDRLAQIPARRIAVEKRVTRYISRHLSRSIFPTRVDYFDRVHRVLVLTGLACPELQHLHAAARSARPQIMHLSFTSDVLWYQRDNVSFENLKCSGNFGDPAYDVASMVSSYRVAGAEHVEPLECNSAIEEFEKAYRKSSANNDPLFWNRVVIYAAFQQQADSVKSEMPAWE